MAPYLRGAAGDLLLVNLRVYLLGAPLVEREKETVHFSRRKTLALLAYLAVTGVSHRRENLSTLLWPEQDRKRGLASLRRCLVSLSRVFSDHLETDRVSIGLRLPTQGLWFDVWQFTETVRGLSAAGKKTSAGPATLSQLQEASELYRDSFLAGFSLPDGEAFDDWQFSQTERFRREQAKILEALVAGHREAGDFEAAIESAQRWLALDRLAEEVHRLLIHLYLEAGERSEAYRQFERCAEILKAELEVEPEPATKALLDEIRGREWVARAAGRAEAPAPDPPSRLRILPAAQTPILGREPELSELTSRLADSACRLLTVIGPGGIGKTRLALEATRRIEEHFQDGVCFIPLAAASPQSMLASITEPLGLTLDPKGNTETQLFTFLADRHLLLVLDNFEHLTEEASLVSRLLSSTPRVRVLVTSRERLSLQGEWLFEVHGLAVPEGDEDAETVASFGAVQMFLQAARRADPDFRLTPEVRPVVIQICRLLVGMPLGIELAAAWLRLVSCQEIASEIQTNIDFLSSTWRDFPERHRSLRAVFESSLRLLNPVERELLIALSEFKGGFSREAAEKVAGASLPLLAGLLDKSLLSSSVAGRYQLHELIRQFAAELLQQQADTWRRIQERHCGYYLELLTDRSRHFPGRREVLAELYLEAENLRQAWSSAVRHRRFDLLETSVDACYQFHQMANWFAEGEERMGAAEAIISKQEHPLLWARTAVRQGQFKNRLGRYRKAQRLLEDSLAIFEELDARQEIAFAQSALSVVSFHLGDFDRAKAMASSAVDLFREVGDKHGLATALVQHSRALGYTGDIEDAKRVLNESYQLFEQLNDSQGMAMCLNNLANLTYLSGQQDEAIRLFELSRKSFEKLGDQRGLAFSFSNMAVVMEDLGNHAEAKEMSQKAISLFRGIGYQEADSRTRGHAIPLENCGRACLGLGEYEEARDCFIAALETSVRTHQTPLVLASLMGLANLLIHEQKIEKAWEIVEVATDHPALSMEVVNQLEDLRARLEKLPGASRPPKSDQLPSIRLRLLIEELLQETPVSWNEIPTATP